ncbi:STAS domain-containing protein [Planctomycetota bacterium]
MSSEQHDDSASRLDEIIDVIMRLAAGELNARAQISGCHDVYDQIGVGLNMLAEELAHLLHSERRLRETLEDQVRERTAEIERKLRRIEDQDRTIRELSTPVLSVGDGILAVPLIGVVDSHRARQIAGDLLQAITNSGAEVVILDITGVPVIDTDLANHLLKTTRAAAMLGAFVILTGMSPQNAQTMVALGVDMSSVTFRTSLKDGLAHALQLRS